MIQINGHRTLVSALDAAWAAIQHQHTDVPGVVLTLGSGALAVTAGLRDTCGAAGVPFFFKQWGGPTPKAGGRLLDGRTWDEMPPRLVH